MRFSGIKSLREGVGHRVLNRRKSIFTMKAARVRVLSALVWVSILNHCPGAAYLQGDRIVVAGKTNTLASVAQDIAAPEIFSFDPEQNLAVANRNLVIKGSLFVGSDEASDASPSQPQALEMNISRCGAVRIEVAASPGEAGELHLKRGKLAAIHETDDKCSDPNVLIVRGTLIAENSDVSGNIGCVIEPGASVELVSSTISYTQDSALSCELQERQQLDIRDCRFIDNANYGIRIGRCPQPLEIRDSVFRGVVTDVFNAGSGDITLTDCDFRSVRFGSLSGKVVRKWTIVVEVPKGGLHVVARSAEGNPRTEIVRGVSDENGVCRLSLTEYVAFPPRAQEFQEGLNNATPHEISVYDRDGKTLLYRIDNFHVFMKGQRICFR